MNDYLFNVGTKVNIICDNKIMDMLVIGKNIKDEDGIIHDYAGVPLPNGLTGKIFYFEHRELLKVR